MDGPCAAKYCKYFGTLCKAIYIKSEKPPYYDPYPGVGGLRSGFAWTHGGRTAGCPAFVPGDMEWELRIDERQLCPQPPNCFNFFWGLSNFGFFVTVLSFSPLTDPLVN